MTTSDTIQRGRSAFRAKSWGEAYVRLLEADQEKSLEPEDLELLAKAAYLIGKDSECNDFWARTYQEFLNREKTVRAAYCAFWLGLMYFNQGDHAQGGGWISRAQRLVDDYGEDCVVMGFLKVPEALQLMRKGETDRAYGLFREAARIGKSFDNPDLTTLGRLGQGQALIQLKKFDEGTKLFDEAMVAVVSDEVTPIIAGIVYCAVIDTCQKIYDLRRAQEWTSALNRWCKSQPDLIPYRGQCLVRRAEIMQLHGEWPDAMNEVQRACEISQDSRPPATGEAFYRQAELCRLQGKFQKAEEAYRRASKFGRKPQPGLALLRLDQGEIDRAKAAIIRAEEEEKDPMGRCRILPAFIDIMLTCDETERADAKAGELASIATELDAPFLKAISNRAMGRTLLANGKPGEAIEKLRNTWSLMEKIGATYEAAQTRALIGLACLKLGDKDTAEMELDAARSIFLKLGAVTDLRRVNNLIPNKTTGYEKTHELTPRELEVLQLLATGKTNKEIASNLFISERTVDRHVSNILGKLNVPTRAAATAYAYEHNLI